LTSAHDVDETDRRLISLLQADGRRSNSGLASALGISAVTVNHRIRRLVSGGYIRNSVFVDPTRSGAPIGAVICLRVSHHRLDAAVDYLSHKAYVLRVTRTLGRYDVVAPSYFASMDEMSAGILEVITGIDGLRSSECLVILQDHPPGEQPVEGLDEHDRLLLGALETDGRQSFAALARRVGLTASTARRRVERLEKAGLVRFAASVNESKAGWFCRALVLLKVAPTRLITVVEQARVLPATRFATAVTGSWDAMVSVVAETRDQIRGMAEDAIARLDGVRDFEILYSEGTVNGGMWASRSGDRAAKKGNKARALTGLKSKRRN
jgi:DNA-binding Lrp family transcriptional regulator